MRFHVPTYLFLHNEANIIVGAVNVSINTLDTDDHTALVCLQRSLVLHHFCACISLSSDLYLMISSLTCLKFCAVNFASLQRFVWTFWSSHKKPADKIKDTKIVPLTF